MYCSGIGDVVLEVGTAVGTVLKVNVPAQITSFYCIHKLALIATSYVYIDIYEIQTMRTIYNL